MHEAIGMWEGKLNEEPKLPTKYGKVLVDAHITSVELLSAINARDLTTVGISLGHAVELLKRCGISKAATTGTTTRIAAGPARPNTAADGLTRSNNANINVSGGKSGRSVGGSRSHRNNTSTVNHTRDFGHGGGDGGGRRQQQAAAAAAAASAAPRGAAEMSGMSDVDVDEFGASNFRAVRASSTGSIYGGFTSAEDGTFEM